MEEMRVLLVCRVVLLVSQLHDCEMRQISAELALRHNFFSVSGTFCSTERAIAVTGLKPDTRQCLRGRGDCRGEQDGETKEGRRRERRRIIQWGEPSNQRHLSCPATEASP